MMYFACYCLGFVACLIEIRLLEWMRTSNEKAMAKREARDRAIRLARENQAT